MPATFTQPSKRLTNRINGSAEGLRLRLHQVDVFRVRQRLLEAATRARQPMLLDQSPSGSDECLRIQVQRFQCLFTTKVGATAGKQFIKVAVKSNHSPVTIKYLQIINFFNITGGYLFPIKPDQFDLQPFMRSSLFCQIISNLSYQLRP
jgi:hypothetical protein